MSAPQGTWLVIDLWAGYSGLCIALLALGVAFYGVAAESDPEARACARHSMPALVHVADVRDVSATPIAAQAAVARSDCRGGSPCQPNSSLNPSRKGRDDPRGTAPQFLHDLVKELTSHPEFCDLEIISFLENVASSPSTVIQAYSAWAGCLPVRSDAACCGWASRNRLYWVRGRHKSLSEASPPPQWTFVPDEVSAGLLKYEGKKPIPSRVHFEDGFQWINALEEVMPGRQRAGHTLTREFWHPEDLVSQVSPEAAARFHLDSCRFPPGAYEDHCLAWRMSEWRQLSPSERSQFLGIPPDATEAVSGRPAARIKKRNSLLGNGFHNPTVMIVLAMIPQLCESRLVVPRAPSDKLHQRLIGTVWEPYRLQTFPGLLGADAVVAHIQSQLRDCFVPHDIWSTCVHRLSMCDLPLMQAFPAWQRLRGAEWRSLPPAVLGRKARARLYAGNTGQRWSSEEAKGLDHLLPPGLGPAEHVRQALELPSPFHHNSGQMTMCSLSRTA